MDKVYVLKCAQASYSAGGDLIDINEVTTGIYSTYELAEEDGEKFVANKEFSAYSIAIWEVISESNKNSYKNEEVKGFYERVH